MGCGASKEDNTGKARNDEIENQLKRDKMAQRNEIKMLLLGRSRPIFISYVPAFSDTSQVLVNLESQLSSNR